MKGEQESNWLFYGASTAKDHWCPDAVDNHSAYRQFEVMSRTMMKGEVLEEVDQFEYFGMRTNYCDRLEVKEVKDQTGSSKYSATTRRAVLR